MSSLSALQNLGNFLQEIADNHTNPLHPGLQKKFTDQARQLFQTAKTIQSITYESEAKQAQINSQELNAKLVDHTIFTLQTITDYLSLNIKTIASGSTLSQLNNYLAKLKLSQQPTQQSFSLQCKPRSQ